MRRPGYREAVEWIALNDDITWLYEDIPIISVTAAMVRDLYGVEDDRLFRDIRAADRKHCEETILRRVMQ